MKRIVLLAVMAMLALPATALAGADKQVSTSTVCGTVTFLQTGSGIVQEWRTGQSVCPFDTTSGSTYYDVHQVWFPTSKFPQVTCDFGALVWDSTLDSTPGTPEITGYSRDYGPFISAGKAYTICVYPINQKSGTLYNSPAYTDCATGAADTSMPVGNVLQSVSSNGKLDTWVRVSGQVPGTYDLWVNQFPGGCPLGTASNPGALTVGPDGTGSAHVTNSVVGGATLGWISVTGNGAVLRSNAIGF